MVLCRPGVVDFCPFLILLSLFFCSGSVVSLAFLRLLFSRFEDDRAGAGEGCFEAVFFCLFFGVFLRVSGLRLFGFTSLGSGEVSFCSPGIEEADVAVPSLACSNSSGARTHTHSSQRAREQQR